MISFMNYDALSSTTRGAGRKPGCASLMYPLGRVSLSLPYQFWRMGLVFLCSPCEFLGPGLDERFVIYIVFTKQVISSKCWYQSHIIHFFRAAAIAAPPREPEAWPVCVFFTLITSRSSICLLASYNTAGKRTRIVRTRLSSFICVD
jgi:hypothetical protein